MSEVGRRPEQTPSFKIKVQQTDTQKHKVGNKSMAGLGWAGASGGGGGLTGAPRGVCLDNDKLEGKGPGAGLAIATASSKHQKTVAPDRWNASFLQQLRKVLAGGLRGIRAHHLAPHRDRHPITRETSPGIPQDTPPKIPHPTQPGNSTECLRRGPGS